MKKRGIFLGFVFITLIIFMGGAFLWWKSNIGSFSEDTTKKRFVISKGQSAQEVGENLEEARLIKSALAFKLYVQITDKQSVINSGEFSISPSMTISEIIEALQKGPSQLWVTIPEGLRREEYPDKFIFALSLSGVEAQQFRVEFLQASEGKEGYLFPDTYLFPVDGSGGKAVSLMENTFNSRFSNEMRSDMVSKGLSLDETVILASILEKETKTNEERPIVAGIYFNRLDVGMPLQADATAQYVTGSMRCKGNSESCDWWKPPTREELQTDSLFNTYKYSGLPPSPIANPGLSSLQAVVYSEDSEYYYYIHEDDGTIHYARTLDEHNDNVNKYLR